MYNSTTSMSNIAISEHSMCTHENNVPPYLLPK